MQKITILHGGSLIFWGDIFGGRYGENYHTVVNAIYDGYADTLTIEFNLEEKCIVHAPKGITAAAKEFYVKDAESIIWTWYYYGRPHLKENLFSIRYVKEAAELVLCQREDFNHVMSSTHLMPKGVYALHFC